ncbi:MAG: hypothetical protein J6Q22_10485 [Prevotella sp.]|nr:hypothetical protein [Prevotella sp.]
MKVLVFAFAVCSFGGIVRSSVGAMHSSMSGEGEEPIDYTAQDYVMDGLVSMWDGIENVGWGLHEDSPEYWIDLVGNDSVKNYGNSASSLYSTWFSDDALQGKPYWEYMKSSGLYDALVSPERTVELVTTRTSDGTTYGTANLVSGNWMQFAGYVGNRYVCRYENTTVYINPPSTAPYTWVITMSCDNGICTIYVNGNVWGTVNSGGMATPNNGAVTLGANLQRVDGTSGFASPIHSIRVYGKALSESEVKANYKVDKARFGL